uniref:Sperm-associated antigen 17 n=1 Tax=Phallusia mammillata TaxID=59560 RepID=A0A6F9DUF2_9ASCI|nr:sperm-associated antigen 17 [Phallusia mammillata]
METPKKGGKRSPRSKSPRGKSPKGGKKKSDAAEKEAEAQKLEEQRAQEELERKLQEAEEAAEAMRKRQRMPSFQQLYISCPDGLNVRYELDPTSAVLHPESSKDEYKLMVRQNYPYKTLGRQNTEQARSTPAMDEVSRTILSDGTVVKVMRDGSTKVLFCNGTVCYNPGFGPLDPKMPNTAHSLPSAVSQQAPGIAEDQRTAASAGSKKGSRGRKSSGKTNPEATITEPSVAGTTTGHMAGLEVEAGAKSEMEQEKAASWFTTYISGESTVTKPNGVVQELDPLLCYVATDPVTGEIMFSREDKVIRVDRPDSGGSVCDHIDGTRITRYCRGRGKSEGEEEEDEQGTSGPVWYVKVECPGFATVTFCHDNDSCLTSFGSGTSLLTNIDGTYQLSHWNGGRIDISNEGAVVYTPRPDNDVIMAALSAAEVGGAQKEGEEEDGGSLYGNLPLPGSEPVSLGSYLMRHDAEICCEAVDQEGNVFQVKKTGEVSVMNPSNPAQTQNEDDNQSTSLKSSRLDPMDHHPPRLFVVNSDGSGTELLRLKDVQEYIGDAHLDPTTAVIKEEVPEDSKVIGITVMRPHYGNSGDAWLLHKEEENIVPRNIRTRDLTHFPPKEVKKPGPPFATTLGKGLAIGSAPLPFVPPPAPACPTALELRQLIQREPLSNEIRQHLKTKLIEFSKTAYEHELQRSAVQVQDPRTDEEQMRASDLLSLVLEFDDEGTPRSPDAVPEPSGMKRVSVAPPDAGGLSNEFSLLVKVKYEAAVAPPPPPKIPPPREKLTQADWDRIRRGIEEEKTGRKALKNRDVPEYFDSEAGRAWLLNQAPDMKAASRQLSSDPRRDGTEAKMFLNRGASPQQDSGSDSSRQRGSGAGIVSDTPSKMRPTNPTPAHASGGGTPTKVRPENPTPIAAAAQQRNVRPSNPTPSKTASDAPYLTQQYQPSPIPENPTSAQKREAAHFTPPQQSSESSDNSRQNNVLPLETEPSDLVLTRSLMYDASGQPRRDRVRLPTSIMSDKPGALPNKKFMEVEDPVRRKVNTSSVAGGLSLGNTKVADRGFQLLPPEVVFGVLREGSTYSYSVKLKNTGIDLCRFKVKQPPPGTGIRVQYTPGPVAAGMETVVNLEIYAIAVGVEGDSGVGTINHMLEIVTETDILHLPVTAIVLTAYDYDNRTEAMPSGGKAPGVKLCSHKPPSREGIVRPIKMTAS